MKMLHKYPYMMHYEVGKRLPVRKVDSCVVHFKALLAFNDN
jgi:hypothetical protein